jgi:DNA-binding transcriptional LysR family regulator
MDIEWNDVRLFLAVAEHGSMTEAARQLGIGQPTASRRLGELEQRLGYALFRRSVEGTSLTNQGERWLDAARHMAEWAGELQHAAEQGDAAPRGVVRITAPPGVAYDFVAPSRARCANAIRRSSCTFPRAWSTSTSGGARRTWRCAFGRPRNATW